MTQKLKMNEQELMMLQNLTLKIAVIQSTAEKQAAPIIAAREQLARAIAERLGIDVSKHAFDVEKGAVTPIDLIVANRNEAER